MNYKENPAYGRMGSKIYNLAEKLIGLGFVVNLEDNPRNRISVGLTQIHCISGNYRR